MSAFSPSTQIPPADFYIPVLCQLPSAQLLLGDALEAGPLEVVRLDVPLGSDSLVDRGASTECLLYH